MPVLRKFWNSATAGVCVTDCSLHSLLFAQKMSLLSPMTRISLTNEELSSNLDNVSQENRNNLEVMLALYQSWENVIVQLAPILAKCPLSVFISHAWHIAPKDCDLQIQRDYQYYDLLDLSIAKILKLAGFQVIYDKDMTANKGIIAQGTDGFMENEVGDADIILSFCTPVYHDRSKMEGTGVFKEVERIKKRISDFNNSSFFIPILVHASIPYYPHESLLVGRKEERIFKSIFLDLRSSREFVSNVFKIIHRMFNNFRKKLDEAVEDITERNILLQQYVEVLGKVLNYDDYFDLGTHKTIRSNAKDDLERMYNSLRAFTTVPKDIDPGELIRQLKEEMNKHSELFVASENKDIVAFLGNTGVGKSTIINFLAGKRLTTDRLKQSYQLVEIDDTSAMKIGMSSESETIYPQWISIGKEVYFDLPGFSDSKGSVQDLVNAAFIRQVLVTARTVKIVFVVGSDEVTSQRGKVVKHLFSSIRSVFPASSVVDDSSVLIVNKSTFQFSRQADLVEYLRVKLRSAGPQTDLSNTLKLWERGNRILHLPNPSVDDISDQPSIRDSIIRAISALKPASHESVKSFDMSRFYPAEIHFPLKNMFFQILTLLSPSLQTIAELEDKIETMAVRMPRLYCTLASPLAALAEYEKIEKYFDSNQEFMNIVKSDLTRYIDSDFQSLLEDTERSLSNQREFKLLTEICQEPFHDARKEFKSLLKEKLTTLKTRVDPFESTLLSGKKKYKEELGEVLTKFQKHLSNKIRFGQQEEDKTWDELADSMTGTLSLSGFGIDENEVRIRIISIPTTDVRERNTRIRLRELDSDSVPVYPGLDVIIVPSVLVDNSPELTDCLQDEFPELRSLHFETLLVFSSRSRYLNNEENYRYFVVKDRLQLSAFEMWMSARIVYRGWDPLKHDFFGIKRDFVDIRHERIAQTTVCCGVCLFCGPYCLFHSFAGCFLGSFFCPLMLCVEEIKHCANWYPHSPPFFQRCENYSSELYDEAHAWCCGVYVRNFKDECGKQSHGYCPCLNLCIYPCVRSCYREKEYSSTVETLKKLQLTISVELTKPAYSMFPWKKQRKVKIHSILPSKSE